MIHPAADPASAGPYGRPELVDGLRDVGVGDGDRLIVHASLRSLG